MKSKLKSFLFSLLVTSFAIMPAVLSFNGPSPVLAVGPLDEGLNKIRTEFPTSGRLTRSQTVGDFIKNLINLILTVALAIAVLFIIIGGYQYITSAGNESRAESGKKTLINAIIGIVVIILSYTIVYVINQTLSR
jgi:hypothetical protein